VVPAINLTDWIKLLAGWNQYRIKGEVRFEDEHQIGAYCSQIVRKQLSVIPLYFMTNIAVCSNILPLYQPCCQRNL